MGNQIHAFAIPRLDPGFEGIHLVWSWPDNLPLSKDGYDVQRLEWRRGEHERRCETIDRATLSALKIQGEVPALLGPLRLKTGVRLTPLLSRLPAAGRAPGDDLGAFAEIHRRETTRDISGLMNAPFAADTAAFVRADADVLIQEFKESVPVVYVTIDRASLVVAMCAGKVALARVVLNGNVTLTAPAIDRVCIYLQDVDEVESIRICAEYAGASDARWRDAPYIARRLTIPVSQADPSLTTPAEEYARAKSRLRGTEALAQADFERMTAVLRVAALSSGARCGEQTLLTRADPAEEFEQTTFNSMLASLAIHPKLRRVLGFGHADNHELLAGKTYVYRVTGRFRADDLNDRILSLARVPTDVTLPAAFHIGEVGFRLPTSAAITLDPEPSSAATIAVSRRGLVVREELGTLPWFLPNLDGCSLVIDFPSPLTELKLEVSSQHTFRYAAGLGWAWPTSGLQTPLGPGPVVELTFATAITQLRIYGNGMLFALRIPPIGAGGIVEISAVTSPVTYDKLPLPKPPVVVSLANLQQPPTAVVGEINQSTSLPTRPAIGFDIRWMPASVDNLPVWPTDLGAGPPLDSVAYVIDHRLVNSPTVFGAWEPLQADDNLTLGSRDSASVAQSLEYGCDLDAVFPLVRQADGSSGALLHVTDIFEATDPSTTTLRVPPPPGTLHQYGIRAMDIVGRLSGVPTLSNVARLETHIPPPVPVGPQDVVALEGNEMRSPPGPRARVLIKGAPGLTPADLATLGTHDNAIVLEWGWRTHEREIDPATEEFRVYRSRPLDTIAATIVSIAASPPNLALAIQADLPLETDELAGQWLSSNGAAFQVVQNTAGTTPTILVRPPTVQPGATPNPGPIIFGRPLRPTHQRPSGWDERVAIYPLLAAETYRHVFYDLLQLSATKPRDHVWLGVAAADAQSYVADELTVGPFANRPGNESGIATCTASGRYYGQPIFSVPPPLGDVPELVTDEPTGRPVLATLDLPALLNGTLPNGAAVIVERCDSDAVFSRLSVAGNDIRMARDDGTAQTIAFANPGDQATVLSTLNSDAPQSMARRYLLHFAVAFDQSDQLFKQPSNDVHRVAPFADRLAPKASRFVYRVRAVDAAGHVSSGNAILPIVVRVPSTVPGPTPKKQTLTTTNADATLTVSVAADAETTSLILFSVATPAGTRPDAQGPASLLRLANRRDLYPMDGIRLLLSNGTLLPPTLSKRLDDADIRVVADLRFADLRVPAARGEWLDLWCFSVTRDGSVSGMCGPFGTGVGA